MARESTKKNGDKIKEKAATSKDVKEKSTIRTKKETTKKSSTTSKDKKTTSKSKVVATNKKSSSVKKQSVAKKTSATKKVSATAKVRRASSASKSTAKPMLAEYYDLPYRYNQTTVKILAQTPTTLFVYWDISDDDRNSLINKYGENFFLETKPILIVHNTTHNYSYELEINDFANSWYIRAQEPDSDYIIELGRKYIENINNNEYIYIRSSNEIVSPNDHVLFDKTNLGHVAYKNVKTGSLSYKDFGSLRFINDIDKLYGNVYDVYSRLYKDELLNTIVNPSSGEFIKR